MKYSGLLGFWIKSIVLYSEILKNTALLILDLFLSSREGLVDACSLGYVRKS
jgi:hypothetical protein